MGEWHVGERRMSSLACLTHLSVMAGRIAPPDVSTLQIIMREQVIAYWSNAVMFGGMT